MEEAPKRKRGRPRKVPTEAEVRPVRLISPPSLGQQSRMIELAREFTIACNLQDQAEVEKVYGEFTALLERLAGVS